MSPSAILLQGTLLPFSALRLGRLVLSVRSPHQDFHDPPALDPAPSVSVSEQQDFVHLCSRQQSSAVRARLLQLLSVSYEHAASAAVSVSAARSSTHLLSNSTDWFRSACATEATRRWLEAAIAEGRDVFLLVGVHTVTDARLVECATYRGGLQNAVDAIVGLVASVMVDGGGHSRGAQARDYSVRGEHVYAVQYRKVIFKWFSSAEKARLEKGNRWKVYWGLRGSATKEDQEDDAIEADVGDVWAGTDETWEREVVRAGETEYTCALMD